MVALCVTPPPCAVIVTLRLPNCAFFAAWICNVELPAPGAAIGFFVKLNVSPGLAETLNDTGELNASVTAVLTVAVALFLRRTVTLGVAVSAKSAVGTGACTAALTVSETVVLCRIEPLVPVIVTV